jgi:hypothetical protein
MVWIVEQFRKAIIAVIASLGRATVAALAIIVIIVCLIIIWQLVGRFFPIEVR